MRAEDGPPPWSWMVTACTALLMAGLGITWLLYSYGGPWDSALRAYGQALTEASTLEGAHRRVLLLGASRMMNATPSGEEISQALEERGIDKVVVNKVGLQGVNLEDYTSLQDELLALNPDIIIVPVDIAIKDRRLSDLWDRQTNAFAQLLYPGSQFRSGFNLRRQERLIVHGGKRKKLWEEQSLEGLKKRSERSWERRNEKTEYRHDGRSVALLERLHKAQRDRGGELLLWDLPLWFPAPEAFEARRRETLSAVNERLGEVEVLDLGPLAAENYIDFVHLNKGGRRIYTERLVEYLAQGFSEVSTK